MLAVGLVIVCLLEFCYAVVIAKVYLFILLISCVVYCCLIGARYKVARWFGRGIGLFGCVLWVCLW